MPNKKIDTVDGHFDISLISPKSMILRGLFCSLILFVLQGCTHQLTPLDIKASQHGFSSERVDGEEFQHQIYTQEGVSKNSTLHVYLDGDGQPWIENHRISTDPTPSNPMLLNLMALDPAPVIYLGRPCYHGFSRIPPCEPTLWTSARYSSRIVKSMQQVLLDYIARGRYKEVILIGHSGGGTLAMLLAERIKATKAVVTIAGNLDIDSWAEHHDYSVLNESMNPAQLSQLDPEIFQFHLIGGVDKNVPYSVVNNFLQTQPAAKILKWEKFDHACCWHEIWPDFLVNLENEFK